MNYKSYLLLLGMLLCCAKLSARRMDAFGEDELKKLVEIEFEKFKPVAVVNNIILDKIVYSNSISTHVIRADNNIFINVEEIEKFTQGESENFKSLFIKFIIAHEMGHKIQYNGYRENVIQSSKGESIVFLECQADILSGMLISQVYNNVEIPNMQKANPNFSLQNYNREFGPTFFAVYKRILEMDNINNDQKTHPDNITRLTAFRNGKLAGDIWTFYFASKDVDLNVQKISAEQFKDLQDTYKRFSKALDFDPSDKTKNNIYIWSHAEAIRLIHENNIIANNLIMYDKYVEWNTSADTPIVYFTFKILNNNNFAIDFNGRVYVEIIPRNNHLDIINSGPTDGYVFDKIINANDSVEISAELNWIADKDYMPQIVLPGEKRSIYWAFPTDNQYVDTATVEKFNFSMSKWNENTLDDLTDLINYVYLRRNDFKNLEKGLGISIALTSDQIKNHKITYPAKFIMNNEEDDQICFEERNKKTKFVINTLHWQDSTIANQNFDALNSKLKETFPGLLQNQPRTIGNTTIISFSDLGNIKTIKVYLKKDYLLKDYFITVDVAEE